MSHRGAGFLPEPDRCACVATVSTTDKNAFAHFCQPRDLRDRTATHVRVYSFEEKSLDVSFDIFWCHLDSLSESGTVEYCRSTQKGVKWFLSLVVTRAGNAVLSRRTASATTVLLAFQLPLRVVPFDYAHYADMDKRPCLI